MSVIDVNRPTHKDGCATTATAGDVCARAASRSAGMPESGPHPLAANCPAYHRILVATDGSAGGGKAVAAAAEMAGRYGAALVALHAYEMPAIESGLIGGGMINGIEVLDPAMLDDWLAGANEDVRRKTCASLDLAGIAYTYRQDIGRSANTIVRVAKEEGADLIVLGSRGLSGFEAFLLGSVSERVAHLAHCSVLLVR